MSHRHRSETEARFFLLAAVATWHLGDSLSTGAPHMAVRMASEEKHSSGGNCGTMMAAVHNTAQQAD